MASEPLAPPPAKRRSMLPTTTTATITTTADNGTTTTTTTNVSAAAKGSTTTTTTTTTAANGTTTTTTTSNATAATTSATCTSTGTTISSLSDDDLREIFLRLPNLPALVRATLTCRSWLGVVRSSLAFRRLFRALHPAPLIGLLLTGETSYPLFVPLRPSDSYSDSDSDSNSDCDSDCDSDVTAALRRGDFFLTSLPQSFSGWTVTDCRDGRILLWNMLHENDMSLATLNPMTWAMDILPLPGGITNGSRRHSSFIGFHLQSSEEKPWLFRVICVYTDKRKVRAAIFSSETWDWVIQPWVHIGGNYSLKFKVGSLVNGSIYWPCHGEGRMIRINTDTLDITSVDLPEQVDVGGCNFRAGETKDGELCIVYHSGLLLHVWIRSVDSDGTEIWVPQNSISLSSEIDRFTQDLHSFIRIVQVRAGYVYLSTTCMTPLGTLRRSFFSLALDTLVLDLLLEGEFHDYFYPYIMAWPPSLVADVGSIGHDAEGSH